MLKRISLCLALLSSSLAFSQGSRYEDHPAMKARADGALVAATATVAVCGQPANTTTTPCSPLITAYTDTTVATPCSGTLKDGSSAGATNCSNPLITDSKGNYHFYTKPGKYTVQIYGSGLTTYNQVDVPISCDVSNCFITSAENVQVVDANFSRGGIDVGDEINKAYAALPAAGGRILIAPKTDGTCYSFTTPIVMTTLNKYALVEYMGAAATTGAGVPSGCLNFTPTSGVAISIDWSTPTGEPFASVHGLRNIYLINNACTTTLGCGGTAIGIDSGTVNAGASEAYFDNIAIVGFAVGFRNLGTALQCCMTFQNPQINDNVVGFLLHSPGPISLVYGTYAGNGTVIKTNTINSSPSIVATGFEAFNNTKIIDATATNSGNGGGFYCSNCHFEASTSAQGLFVSGVIDLIINGGVMEVDIGGGTTATMLNMSGNYVDVSGVAFLSSATVTNILTANSPVKGKLSGEIVGSFFGTPYVTGADAISINTHLTGFAGVGDIQTYFKSLLTPSFELSNGNGLIIDEDGVPPTIAAKDVCYGDSGTHSIRCSYNNSAFSNVALNPPLVAGGTDLGTTALPFGNLWLGTAATSNFKFQPAATAAARVISMPDPLGAVNMPYVIAAGTTTLTANAALAAVTSQAANTTTATNTLTTDAIEWSYATAPGAGDNLCHIAPYVTAGNVNFVRTNPTAAAQNVTAIVINWRVIR